MRHSTHRARRDDGDAGGDRGEPPWLRSAVVVGERNDLAARDREPTIARGRGTAIRRLQQSKTQRLDKGRNDQIQVVPAAIGDDDGLGVHRKLARRVR